MRRSALTLVCLLGTWTGCEAPVGPSPDSGALADAPRASDGAVHDDAPAVIDASSPDAAVPPPADWLVAGGDGSCVSRAGRVSCWGRAWTGLDRTTPAEIPELAGALTVGVGAGHACAVLSDGHVACAGENRGGQLGLPPSELAHRDTFEIVSGAPIATGLAVSHGGSTTCALATDGAVWCWGDDSLGQTGSPIPHHASGALAPQPTPARVAGVDGAVEIVMGQYQSCARLADGHVRCWGYDWFGALGRGAGYTGLPQSEPADVEGIEDAIGLALDGNGGCVLRESGEVACWGGQVHLYPGYDAATDDECPVVVTQVCWRAPRALALPAAAVLVLGGGAGCVAGATPGCFGRTLEGLLDLDGVGPDAALAMGRGHLCALAPDGEVTCRGRGEQGQLGDGRSVDSTDWVRPALP